MKFQIYADTGGKYRWRLVSRNGQNIASSAMDDNRCSNAARKAPAVAYLISPSPEARSQPA